MELNNYPVVDRDANVAAVAVTGSCGSLCTYGLLPRRGTVRAANRLLVSQDLHPYPQLVTPWKLVLMHLIEGTTLHPIGVAGRAGFIDALRVVDFSVSIKYC